MTPKLPFKPDFLAIAGAFLSIYCLMAGVGYAVEFAVWVWRRWH